jgi:phospholipase/lecithinase/hemolysin
MRSSFQVKEKPAVSHIVILGDSLSDRGTLEHRYLFGIIPMAYLAGLTDKSPIGRFANGFVWSDDISAMASDEFIIRYAEKNYVHSEHKKYKPDTTDLSDAILTQPQSNEHELPDVDVTDVSDSVIASRYFKKSLAHSYTLKNNLYVQYRGRDFVRSYDEGGLSSHDYSHNSGSNLDMTEPTTSVSVFASRLILSNLGAKRKAMLEHDRQVEFSLQQKKHTLVIEWSGANDLITVNLHPTNAEADRAVKDRILNAEELIKKGYRQFVLFNLPDLSLTPRFQNMQGSSGASARQNAQNVCEYFNTQLQTEVQNLQEKYKELGVYAQVYDVSKLFTNVYNDTKNQTGKFPVHFDKDKLAIPFIDAKNFVDKDHLSPASGYMFWNDVHPSAEMQALLAEEFYNSVTQQFVITPPRLETADMLCATFRKKIRHIQESHETTSFVFFRGNESFPKIDYSNAGTALAHILKLANEKGGQNIRAALVELQWMDDKGKVNTQIPALREANEQNVTTINTAKSRLTS